jgi:hypothetical protein
VTTQKAIETYEGVFHRLNGFLLDLTVVGGKGRLQEGRFSCCALVYTDLTGVGERGNPLFLCVDVVARTKAGINKGCRQQLSSTTRQLIYIFVKRNNC